MSVVSSLRRVSRQLFGRYLLLTNTLSSGALMALGDVAAQAIPHALKRDGTDLQLDWPRTGRMMIIGLALGPFNHGWYKVLDHVLPKASTSSVVRKILMDQIVGSPILTFAFFTGYGALEGRAFTDSWAELQDKFLTVYKADWTFWPPAQFINFYYVNPKHRVLYVSFAALIWNVFLSFAKHSDVKNILTVHPHSDSIEDTSHSDTGYGTRSDGVHVEGKDLQNTSSDGNSMGGVAR